MIHNSGDDNTKNRVKSLAIFFWCILAMVDRRKKSSNISARTPAQAAGWPWPDIQLGTTLHITNQSRFEGHLLDDFSRVNYEMNKDQ